MTDYHEYIGALRKCAKEHENDRTSTGQIIVSNLCEVIADLLEDLSSSEKPNKSEIPTSSTTKNDLAVREFEEIVVTYPPEDSCAYPEYKGKPYFNIKYKEGNDCFIGYGTYNPKVLSSYLRDYFIPSVTPIRPKGHWIMTSDYLTTAYGSVDYVKCSCCSEDSLEEWNFCPNCGAEMEEEEE